MNIGIDFNTKTSKGAFLIGNSNVEDCKIFEVKNILVFVNGDIFSGDDGFNKFLTEKDSTIYDLDQIIEWNGLIVNKKQISAEKCLSVIFVNLLSKIKTHAQNNEVGFVCVSIPYDKYYYWHGLMKKAFSLIGIEKVRVVSQPAAFFGQPNINHLHGSLNQENLRREQQRKYLHNQEVKKHQELPWHKKFLSKKPQYQGENESTGYVFASVSQDNTNVSLVSYGEDVLEVVSTQYTNNITRRKIEHTVLDYFISEISKDPRNFSVKDKKIILRILETVNEFLKTPQTGSSIELNLPYILCEDGEYRTLDTKIDLDALRNFLAPTFNSLVETIKMLAQKTQEAQKDYKYQTKIGNIIVVGDLFIQQSVKETLSKAFDSAKIAFGNEKSLAIGTLNFSRIMTGENSDFLALEVIPFSVLIRLRGGEFVEMIKKDTTTPTISKEHSFEIKGEGKSKFVEVHLTTKEGDIYKKNYRIRYCVGCELEKTDSELENNRCPLHPNQDLEIYEEENYFFRFSKYQKPLFDFYQSNPDFVLPLTKYHEIKSFVERGLEDFSVSRLKSKMPWGIDVPDDQAHVMFVWFDALVNYISALGWPEDVKRFSGWWPGLQVAGKDNLRQQTAIWQAMLMSAGLPNSLQVVIHGFITVNGQKISKSLGNVVNPLELAEKYGIDALRHYLLAKVHPWEDSDFTIQKFEEIYNADLANGLGNLVSRILAMVEKYCLGKAPKVKQDLDSHPLRIDENIYNWKKARLDLDKAMVEYQFNDALTAVWRFIGEADKYIDQQKPWILAKQDKQDEINWILYGLLDSLYQVAWQIQPFLPDTSRRIAKALAIKKLLVRYPLNKDSWANIKPGTKIKNPRPLFPKIEA